MNTQRSSTYRWSLHSCLVLSYFSKRRGCSALGGGSPAGFDAAVEKARARLGLVRCLLSSVGAELLQDASHSCQGH